MVTAEATERIDWPQIRTHAESVFSWVSQPPSGGLPPFPDLEIFNDFITQRLRVIQRYYGARAPFNAGCWTGGGDTYNFVFKRISVDEQGSPTDRLTDRHIINDMAILWYNKEKRRLYLQITQEEQPSLTLLHSVIISDLQKAAFCRSV